MHYRSTPSESDENAHNFERRGEELWLVTTVLAGFVAKSEILFFYIVYSQISGPDISLVDALSQPERFFNHILIKGTRYSVPKKVEQECQSNITNHHSHRI